MLDIVSIAVDLVGGSLWEEFIVNNITTRRQETVIRKKLGDAIREALQEALLVIPGFALDAPSDVLRGYFQSTLVAKELKKAIHIWENPDVNILYSEWFKRVDSISKGNVELLFQVFLEHLKKKIREIPELQNSLYQKESLERMDEIYSSVIAMRADVVELNRNLFNEQETRERYRTYLSIHMNMPNTDPYSEYLKMLFENINEFLEDTFKIATGGTTGHEESIPLSFQVKNGIVNDKYAFKRKPDSLTNVIGKRYKGIKSNYTDLREAYLDYKGRLLVLGEGGAGKTIALLLFARDSILRRLEDPTKPLPILGIVPTWDYNKQPTISQWLQEDQAPENVETIIQEGRALLILDGLDELIPNPMTSIDPQAMFLNALPKNNHIVLTCRFHTSTFLKEELRLNGAVAITPLSESQILSYTKSYNHLPEIIAANLTLLSLINTPLLLTLFIEAYCDAPNDKITEIIQEKDGFRIKNKIIELALQQRWNRVSFPGKQRSVQKHFFASLEKVACEMYMQGPFKNITVLKEEDILEQIDQKIILYADQMNLLVKATEESWRFSHLFFRDFLAFQYCLNTISSHLKHEADWERKLVYLAHSLDFNSFDSDDGDHYAQEILNRCVEIIRDAKQHKLLFNAVFVLNAFGEDSTDTYYLLLADSNDFVRLNALYALTNIDDVEPFAISILEKVLDTSSSEIRREIVEHISETQNPLFLPILGNLVKEDDWNISGPVAAFLISCGNSALEYVIDEIANPQLIEMLRENSGGNQKQILEILLKQIEEDEDMGGLYAGIVLCIFADDQTIAYLTDLLIKFFDSKQKRSNIVWLITNIAKRYPVSIHALLRSDNEHIRYLALSISDDITDESAIDLLISTLQDTAPHIRIRAAYTLTCYGPDILAILLERAFDKPEEIYIYQTLEEKANLMLLSESTSDDFLYRNLFEKALSELKTATDKKVSGREELLIALLAMAGKVHPEGIPLMINALKTSNKNSKTSLKYAISFVGRAAYPALVAARDNIENKKIQKDIDELLAS